MDRAIAAGELPIAYAVAIRLHDAGHDDLIHVALGAAPGTGHAILTVAEAKLAEHLARTDSCT